jgi:Bacterial TSP3 repeat/IPT/TIG domain
MNMGMLKSKFFILTITTVLSLYAYGCASCSGDDDDDTVPTIEQPEFIPTEGDADGDGIADEIDNCPDDPNPDQLDTDGDTLGDLCDPNPEVPDDPASFTDTDSDGYNDDVDNCVADSNPDQADYDGDGEGDVCDDDADNDGLSNTEEATMGTDPLDEDSDDDGLDDFAEGAFGSDPLLADTDGDGLNDGDEFTEGTDPLDADSDDDGLNDGDEIAAGTDPNNPDTDGDGLLDGEDPNPTNSDLTVTSVDPSGIIYLLDSDETLTVRGSGFSADTIVTIDTTIAPSETIISCGAVTFVSETEITCTIPSGTYASGAFDVVAHDGLLTGTLQDGFTISAELPPEIISFTPTSGHFESTVNISISGENFKNTPTVYFAPVSTVAVESSWVEAYQVTYNDELSVSATFPGALIDNKVTADTRYWIILENPGGLYASSQDSFPTPVSYWASEVEPPQIDTVSPDLETVSNDFTLTISGYYFNSSTATVVSMSRKEADGSISSFALSALTFSDCTDDICSTLTAFVSHDETNQGGYAVSVTNPDGQHGDYSSVIVISSATGQQLGGFDEMDESLWLNIARGGHGATAGEDELENRFIYAIGGSDGVDVLGSVEHAAVDLYGRPGSWTLARTANDLLQARSDTASYAIGDWIYTIGGVDAADDVLYTVERAQILSPLDRADAPTASPASGGSLPAGYWYYRISVVDPIMGEGLASKSVHVSLGSTGSVDLQSLDTAAIYNIYRSPAADGFANTELLVAENISGSVSWTDDGTVAPAPGHLVASGTDEAGSMLLDDAYFYRVSALVASDETEAGYEISANVILGQNAILVEWDEVPGATEYMVYRQEATATIARSDDPYYLLAATEETFLIDTGLDLPDTNFATPTGIAPRPVGSLSTWQSCNSLNLPRRGMFLSRSEVGEKKYIYAIGGTDMLDAGTIYDNYEFAEVLANGALGTWQLLGAGAADADNGGLGLPRFAAAGATVSSANDHPLREVDHTFIYAVNGQIAWTGASMYTRNIEYTRVLEPEEAPATVTAETSASVTTWDFAGDYTYAVSANLPLFGETLSSEAVVTVPAGSMDTTLITVYWDEVTGATEYYVYRSPQPTSAPVLIATVTDLEFSDTGLAPSDANDTPLPSGSLAAWQYDSDIHSEYFTPNGSGWYWRGASVLGGAIYPLAGFFKDGTSNKLNDNAIVLSDGTLDETGPESADLNLPRGKPGVATVSGYIYIYGGMTGSEDAPTPTASIEVLQ